MIRKALRRVASFLAVHAERRSLEDIAKPFTTVNARVTRKPSPVAASAADALVCFALAMHLAFREATVDDVEHIRWALYAALAWNPERELSPPDVALEHPEAVRYHQDWGRTGDLGVIAEADGEVVGVAYCRLFTADDHGYGYVDAETPEIAIAVRDRHRGAGVGERLLADLATAARDAGFRRLSLSVEATNRARRLYERAGYREIGVEGQAVRMVLDLHGRDQDADEG